MRQPPENDTIVFGHLRQTIYKELFGAVAAVAQRNPAAAAFHVFSLCETDVES